MAAAREAASTFSALAASARSPATLPGSLRLASSAAMRLSIFLRKLTDSIST